MVDVTFAKTEYDSASEGHYIAGWFWIHYVFQN